MAVRCYYGSRSTINIILSFIQGWIIYGLGGLLATGVFLFAFLTFFIKYHRNAKQKAARALQKEWDKAGKDVVVLHMPQRAIYAPNPSPFPMKLETWLRMNKVK